MTTARALAAPAPCSSSDPRPTSVARSLGQLLGSNALVSLIGLACLPFLARNLGPAGYGHFSLFLTGLGLLSSLDIARPTLVRELSRGARRGEQRELLALASFSQLALVPLSFALGTWFFGLAAGAALALGVGFFVATSAPYALLAAQGRVGLAATVRNLGWAAAFLTTTALSFRELPLHAYLWPFVVANAGIFAVDRHLAGPARPVVFARPDLSVLRRFRGRSLDILGLSLAVAVVVSADKLMLERSASGEAFGTYTAQYDLAVKLNLFSTALGTVLFPALSQRLATQGFEAVARSFVRRISWVVLGYFAVIALLLTFSDELVQLMLGAEFGGGPRIYPWVLVGVFLALFGHVLTPWQRALGDFRSQRRAYGISALLMVAVGAYAIPRHGAAGALAAYLVARTADVLLIATEVVRLPREILAPWRLVALAAMLAGLAGLAAHQALGTGGGA